MCVWFVSEKFVGTNIFKQATADFRTVKWCQVLRFIVCTQLNSFKYCYLKLLVLFAHSLVSCIAIQNK